MSSLISLSSVFVIYHRSSSIPRRGFSKQRREYSLVAAIVAVVVMRGWVFGGCLLSKWDEWEGGGVFVYRNPKLIETRGPHRSRVAPVGTSGVGGTYATISPELHRSYKFFKVRITSFVANKSTAS